jgi:predicted HicB family RNase H-like nuclease
MPQVLFPDFPKEEAALAMQKQVTRPAGKYQYEGLSVIRIPDDTQRLAKAMAALRGETIGTFVAHLIEQEATVRLK